MIICNIEPPELSEGNHEIDRMLIFVVLAVIEIEWVEFR